MEILIAEKLLEIYPTLNCCDCDQCRTDIYLRTMNSLLPKYVSTPKGEILARIDARKMDGEIVAAIHQAADVVRSRPRHSDGQ